MDLILALKFISSQHLDGVIDGREFYNRLVGIFNEAIEEDVDEADANMLRFAQFMDERKLSS